MVDFRKVVFAVFVFAVVVPLDIFPLVGNVFAAFGALVVPFAHIGCFKLAMGIVVLLSALGHKHAFAEPPECRSSRLRFRHMSDWHRQVSSPKSQRIERRWRLVLLYAPSNQSVIPFEKWIVQLRCLFLFFGNNFFTGSQLSKSF